MVVKNYFIVDDAKNKDFQPGLQIPNMVIYLTEPIT